MNAYYVILIGLSASVVLIGVYGYIDYMSDRHISDMYTGLRDMMDSIKERLRILEDAVAAMDGKAKSEEVKNKSIEDTPEKTKKELQKMNVQSNTSSDDNNLFQYKKSTNIKKVTITEPIDVMLDKDLKL